jgi:hypothetical protein
LVFSSKQAEKYKIYGINSFLEEASFATLHGQFLILWLTAQIYLELQQYRKNLKMPVQEQIKELRKRKHKLHALELKSCGGLMKCKTETYPLRRSLFWHNHFVSTLQK